MILGLPLLEFFESGDVVSLARAMSRKGGSTVRATITPTLLTAAGDTTGGTTQATASVAPAANALIIAAIVSNTTAANEPTATGNGLTWVSVATVQFNSNARRLTLLRAMGAAPSAGAITFDFGGQSQASCAWAIIQCAGVNTSGTNGSGAVVQSDTTSQAAGTTVNITLPGAMEHANNIHLAFTALSTQADVTVDPQFTELADVNTSAGALTLNAMWALTELTCDPTYSTATAGAIGIEVKAG